MKSKIILSLFCVILAVSIPIVSIILVYIDGQSISIFCTENYLDDTQENPFNNIKITGDIYDGISLINFTVDKGETSHKIKYLGNNGRYNPYGDSYITDTWYYNYDTQRNKTMMRTISNNLEISFQAKNGNYMFFKDESYYGYFGDGNYSEGADIYEINNRYYVVPYTYDLFIRGIGGVYDITGAYLSKEYDERFLHNFNAREISLRPVGEIPVESGQTQIIGSAVSGRIIVIIVRNIIEDRVEYSFKFFDTVANLFVNETSIEIKEANPEAVLKKSWTNDQYITFEIPDMRYSDSAKEEKSIYITVDTDNGVIVGSPVISWPYKGYAGETRCVLFKDNIMYVAHDNKYDIWLAAYKNNECIYEGKLGCDIEYDTATDYGSIPRQNRRVSVIKME